MGRGHRRLAAGGLLLAGLLAAAPAAAEVRVTGVIASDDRFRGRSVSEGRPVASLDLAYDAANGAYVGVTTTGVAHAGPQLLAVQAYAGYVARLGTGPAIDVGVTHANYSSEYDGHNSGRYSEVYAGLVTRRFATHLYYSPDYFASGRSTLYGEIDSSVSPAPSWRISGHAGVLRVLHGPRGPGLRRPQYDWRIGVTKALGGFDLQLAWAGAGPEPDYYAGRTRSRSGLVASLTRLF